MNTLSGFYRGVVVSRADPLQAGRCQIRIMPVFEGVADSDLPWAVPVDAMMGGNPNIGGSFIPAPNAIVMCGFEQGDWRYPFYMGALPSMLNGTPDLPTDTQTNYPWRKVYRSEAGTEILIDDKSGSTLFKVLMANGFYVEVDDSGNQTENIPGTLNVTVHGNVTITADANVTANVTGDVNATITGATTVTGTGDISVISSSTVNITAPIVNISGT